MSDQLTHTESFFSEKQFPVSLLLDNITSEANIGSIFRLADAFGVNNLIFCGTPPNIESNRLKRTSRNTHKTVSWEYADSADEVIKEFRSNDYKIVAIEITRNSIPLDKYKNLDSKLLLVAGNERHGISQQILEKCDECVHIEMFGKNSSMNVAQSVGIVLYELTKALKLFHKK